MVINSLRNKRTWTWGRYPAPPPAFALMSFGWQASFGWTVSWRLLERRKDFEFKETLVKPTLSEKLGSKNLKGVMGVT